MQGKAVKCLKEKKRVPGWSIQEMKEKPNNALVEDSEEVTKWRGLSLTKVGIMWLKEWKRTSWTSTRLKKVIERLSEVEVLFWNGERYAKARNTE